MPRLVYASFAIVSALALTAVCMSQEPAPAIPKSDLMEPETLANAMKGSASPHVISVAFPVLYRSRHIPHAVFAGPGSKPEGLAMLKNAVQSIPKAEAIVIYCGCCPMDRCPNVRPTYALLKQMGFTNVKVLHIPTNMHDDWFSKGYPGEEGDQP